MWLDVCTSTNLFGWKSIRPGMLFGGCCRMADGHKDGRRLAKVSLDFGQQSLL